MRVIARSTLYRFLETLAGTKTRRAVKSALDAWFPEVSSVQWRTPTEIRSSFAAASFVGGDRVVFNIKGNGFRLVAAVDYENQILFIKWLGSHEEYDRIDARTVAYGDQAYQKRN